MLSMDVAFLVLLFSTSLTGLLLLAFRETSAMGTLLVIHLGFVAGFSSPRPTASSPTWSTATLRSCAIPSSSVEWTTARLVYSRR